MAMASAFRGLANRVVAGLHSTIFVSTRYSVTQSVSKKVSDRIVELLAIDPDGNRHAIVGLTGHTLLKTLANGGLIDPECHRLEDIAACAGECELQGLTMACAGECELQGLTIDGSELAHLRDFLKTSFRGKGNAQVEIETFYIEYQNAALFIFGVDLGSLPPWSSEWDPFPSLRGSLYRSSPGLSNLDLFMVNRPILSRSRGICADRDRGSSNQKPAWRIGLI